MRDYKWFLSFVQLVKKKRKDLSDIILSSVPHPLSTGEEEKKLNWEKRKRIPCNKSRSMCCSYLLIKGFSFSLFPHLLPVRKPSHSLCTSNTSSLFYGLFCGCLSILVPSHLSFAALFACWLQVLHSAYFLLPSAPPLKAVILFIRPDHCLMFFVRSASGLKK